MSYLTCRVSNLVVNEDQSITATVDLCNVCHKVLQTYENYPSIQLEQFIENNLEYKANGIQEFEINKHLEAGTMPQGATKKSIIMDYVHDETNVLPP